MKVKYFIIPFGMILWGVNTSAQDVADSLTLEEVVVTGTKTIRNLNEVPARISVIGKSVIEASPSMLIDDLLRFTAGVNVDRASGIYSSNPSVTLRGLSGDEQSRTLVLMNGVPINASDGGSVNWNKINQYDVERIEVFKGPGSSLYGNNAMGGVINIITKTPDKPQEVFGSVSYGTYNTLREDLSVRIRTGKGYYGSIAQNFITSDGYIDIPGEERTETDIKRFYQAVDVSARAGNDRSQWFKWELQYDLFRDKRGEGVKMHIPEGCYRKFDTDMLRASLKGGNDRTSYHFNAYYQMINYNDLNERMRSSGYERYDVDSYRKDWGILFDLSHKLGNHNTITGGLEYKNGSIRGGDYYQTAPYDTVYNEGVSTTCAVYLQDEHAFFDERVRLIAGLRYDLVRFTDGYFHASPHAAWGTPPTMKDHQWSELSPRIGLRFNFIKQLSAYLSWSHGFRASILDDLTRTGYMWIGPKYANPDLGPESIDNYEIGADLLLSSRFKLSASAYHALGDNFLYYVASGDELSPGRPIYRRENVTGVTLSGVEAELSYMPVGSLRLMASYTFCKSRIDRFDLRPDLENKYLTYVPKNRVSLSALWHNKVLDVFVRGLYKGRQYASDDNSTVLDAFTTFDLQLSRSLFHNFSISLDIQDVFDNQHMQTQTTLSPGRLISGRIAIKF